MNGTGLWRKEICALILELRSGVSGLSDGVCVIRGGLEADPFAVASTMTTSWRLLEDEKNIYSFKKYKNSIFVAFFYVHSRLLDNV
jgi:hypothetical protein